MSVLRQMAPIESAPAASAWAAEAPDIASQGTHAVVPYAHLWSNS